MNDAAIEVSGVWKKFRRGELHDSLRDFIPEMAKRLLGRGPKRDELCKDDFWALKDVSFEVRRGEAVGVIGPNGAGKSTLLKILSRILRPNRGRYRVNGRLRAMLEVAAGFHPDLTGRENIYLNGSILGMRKREIARKFDAIVEFSGIEPFIDTPVKRYSSGMRARLGYSVSAHLDPEILLIDEVLAVGDAAFRAKCIRHMKQLIRSEASVIFVSHHMDQVRELCDRGVVLNGGSVAFAGDVPTACQTYLDVLQNPVSDSERDISFLTSEGRLLGLTPSTQPGLDKFHVESGKPLSLDIHYELFTDLDVVALGVGFFKADGQYIISFNNWKDSVPVPAHAGRHTVRLAIDYLPFCAGTYFIGLRLLDVAKEQTIDVHERRYPLTVAGPVLPAQYLFLPHTWAHLNNGFTK